MSKFKMPSALVIVFIVLLLVSVLTWLVPTSIVVTTDSGVKEIHYNTGYDSEGNMVEDVGPSPKGIWDIFLAPVLGFQAAGNVAFTILISGAFLQILNFIGALDAGIGQLLKKFSGNTLIILLMLVFAIMGTVYGSWEELPAYAIIIIPLFVTAGYDVITGISVVLIGATIGNMASIVNPYSVGSAVAAIDNPELSLGSGILMRIILFALLFAVGVFLVIRYANSVKANPSKSVVADVPNIDTRVNRESDAFPELTKRRKWSLIVFGIMILATILGYIPWDSITMGEGTLFDIVNAPKYWLSSVPILGDLLGAKTATEFAWWYFDEFSIVFLIGSIIVAFINKMSEKDFVREFMTGCKDLLGVVMVLSVAKGIALTMGSQTEGMSITFIYWIKSVLSGVPIWAFAIAAIITYMLIGLFLQSTSGVSGITMPIFGAVAMALFSASAVGAVGGQIVLISGFTVGINFMSCIYPGATVMGILELSNVPYDRYLKMVLKILLPMLVAGGLIISIAPYIGLI